MAEESIFIVDIGSSSVKAGYMGEDMPSYVFPSSLTQYQERLEVRNIVMNFIELVNIDKMLNQ